MAMEKDMLESLEFQELPNSNSGKYKFLSIYIEEYTDQVFFLFHIFQYGVLLTIETGYFPPIINPTDLSLELRKYGKCINLYLQLWSFTSYDGHDLCIYGMFSELSFI